MRYLILLGIAVSASFCIAILGYNIAVEMHCADGNDLNLRVCVNLWIVTIVTGVVNTLIDIYIMILPIPLILRLQLTPRRKFGVIIIFAIGLL